MVHGLHPYVTENTLYFLFCKYGRIWDIRIVYDYASVLSSEPLQRLPSERLRRLPSERLRRHSRGYGYVDFTTPQEAANAKKFLNGYILENKWLSIKLQHYKK